MINTGSDDLENLIACPKCDALHRIKPVADGARARCSRCHAVLFAPRAGAVRQLVSFAAAAVLLMTIAVTAPFLELEAAGISSFASVLDAILAFSRGLMAPLSITVAAFILFLPLYRLLALLYALLPLLLRRPPWPGAERVFRSSIRLRPWAMAEIFMIGVSVALIKIAGLATVSFGPAFWALAGVATLIAVKDILMCERTIWRLLDQARQS